MVNFDACFVVHYCIDTSSEDLSAKVMYVCDYTGSQKNCATLTMAITLMCDG